MERKKWVNGYLCKKMVIGQTYVTNGMRTLIVETCTVYRIDNLFTKYRGLRKPGIRVVINFKDGLFK